MTKSELKRIGPYLNGKVCEVTRKETSTDGIEEQRTWTLTEVVNIAHHEGRLYNADTGEQLNIASITKIEPRKT